MMYEVKQALKATAVACSLVAVATSSRMTRAVEPNTEMDIRLEGSQNGQDFPVLLIHLKRDGIDVGHMFSTGL